MTNMVQCLSCTFACFDSKDRFATYIAAGLDQGMKWNISIVFWFFFALLLFLSLQPSLLDPSFQKLVVIAAAAVVLCDS